MRLSSGGERYSVPTVLHTDESPRTVCHLLDDKLARAGPVHRRRAVAGFELGSSTSRRVVRQLTRAKMPWFES